MIVIRLMGGLGNQMFQYATGRALALKNKTELGMDNIWFSLVVPTDTPRHYELDCFKIQAKLLPPSKFVVLSAEPPSLKTKIYRQTKGLFKPKLNIYRENGHEFNKSLLDLPDNTYLEGWWNTEKYFSQIRDTLLQDFSFKSEPSAKNKQFLAEIASGNAISLHVRRSDYANNKLTNKFHGLMGLDYYKKAIELISKQLKNPHFYVFSDEPEWCKQNLKISYPTTYISHNKVGFEDLRLMSHCQHHIIANSSFSWWGAWLNPNPDKIVYGPKRWFQDTSVNTSDVIPSSWHKI